MDNRYFGEFGGSYVPEILFPALRSLESAFNHFQTDKIFQDELKSLLRNYAGRPTPLTLCRNYCRESGSRIFLKREDLLHGGAHKTNQVLAQALLTRHMGKSRVIAETGAGQHGVATALACALLDLECVVYMGKKDTDRQALNVKRMELMGAKVISVDNGSASLKDAINEALRDWAASYDDTHYLLGTAAGPHPFPTIVRDFQRVIGDEARAQMLAMAGGLPDAVVACVGGGSNAIGIFTAFLEDQVELIGVEPAGHGMDSEAHGATLNRGQIGILHGARTKVLQDSHGQIQESHSISAGLDYPAVGPEHVYLQSTGRASYVGAEDDAAVESFKKLSMAEGIIPALETAHALAHVEKMVAQASKPLDILVNLSGRGDKDLNQFIDYEQQQGGQQ